MTGVQTCALPIYLVAYIDANYRTIAGRGSRGLSGHSMGGYGTVRIGMKHPEVFGAIFAMSSCCLMNQAPSLEAVEREMARAADVRSSARIARRRSHHTPIRSTMPTHRRSAMPYLLRPARRGR